MWNVGFSGELSVNPSCGDIGERPPPKEYRRVGNVSTELGTIELYARTLLCGEAAAPIVSSTVATGTMPTGIKGSGAFASSSTADPSVGADAGDGGSETGRGATTGAASICFNAAMTFSFSTDVGFSSALAVSKTGKDAWTVVAGAD